MPPRDYAADPEHSLLVEKEEALFSNKRTSQGVPIVPRPPVLKTVDWPQVFASGLSFEAWMQQGESQENRDTMRELIAAQPLEPQTEGLLKALPRVVHVVAIAEDWCGDVIRHVPVLERLAQAAPNLKTAYISREQHPDVFVRFLTNGGEAIPKFVFLSDAFVECGHWGPMPWNCRCLVARGKACGNVARGREKVTALYQMDAEKAEVVRELVDLVCTASCITP